MGKNKMHIMETIMGKNNMLTSKADWNGCFSCEKLSHKGYFFFCETHNILFSPVEDPIYGCKQNTHSRDCLKGKAIDLYRLLVTVGQPLLMDSIPSTLTGTYGILKKYNLAILEEGIIKSINKDKTLMKPIKSNYIVLK
jgi:hypothetical protein